MIIILHYSSTFLELGTATLGIVFFRRLPFNLHPIIRLTQSWAAIQLFSMYYRTFTLPENTIRRAIAHWFTATGQWFPYQVQYNNLPFFHISRFVEGVFLFLFFRQIFASRLTKQVLTIGYIAITLAGIVLLATLEPFLVFDSIHSVLTSAYVIVFGIVYYYEVYSRTEISNLLHHWEYWMVGVAILFSAGTFFSDLALNTYLFSDRIAIDITVFRSILGLIFYLTIITIIWRTKQD